MKYLIGIIFITLTFSSCRNAEENEETPALNEEQLEEVAYLSYGENITNYKAMDEEDLAAIYANLGLEDTVDVKVKTYINEVCTMKGCWIEIAVGEETARVTFKDYGFFLPKNSQGKEVILLGKAFKSKTSIEDLKHYAKDGGKSKEEIDAITDEEITMNIVASGALVESFENPDVITASPAKTSK
jgi:hypothetical protein